MEDTDLPVLIYTTFPSLEDAKRVGERVGRRLGWQPASTSFLA